MSRDVSQLLGGSDSGDLHKHIRLIGVDLKQRGIMTLAEAMKISDDERAVLVKIPQSTSPPIYRLLERNEYRKHI